MFPERGVHFRCPGMENFILRTDAAGTKKLRDQVGEDVEKIAVRVSGFIANASSQSLSTEMKTKRSTKEEKVSEMDKVNLGAGWKSTVKGNKIGELCR